MLAPTLALLLAAAPQPLTLSMPPFEAEGLPDGEAAWWAARLANGLRRQGVRVVQVAETASEAAPGATSDAAPEAPADAAPGGPPAAAPETSPDATLRGQLARVAQSGVRIDLRVIDAAGRALAAFSMTAQSQGEVPEVLLRASQELAGELFRRTKATPVPQKEEPLPPAPDPPPVTTKLRPGIGIGIAIAVLGAAGLGTGLALYVNARNQLNAVARGEPPSYFVAQQQALGAKELSLVSTVLMGAGGALLAGGALYALYSSRVNTFVSIQALLAPDAGGFVVSGVFP